MNTCLPSTLKTSLRVCLSGKLSDGQQHKKKDRKKRGGGDRWLKVMGKKRSGRRQGDIEGGAVICRDPLQGKLFIAWPSLPIQFALNSPKFIIHISLFTIYLVRDQIFPLCAHKRHCVWMFLKTNILFAWTCCR